MSAATLGRSCIKYVINFSTSNRQWLMYSKYAYESNISLRTLYPTSSLKLITPNKLPESIDGKFSGYIPLDKLKITYSRSSGPGGQAVNMVNTKVDLRFHIDSADWLHESTRAKLKEKEKMKVSKEGFLIIRSEKTRSQQLNLADALEKLRCLIRHVEEEPAKPSPETEEMITKRKVKANQIRLIEKRSKALLKSSRKAPAVDL
ncbi:large ribosomal subunit protein mL62 [Lycorma delicatula]|uniref:large ribosomal subunit protein mL62 n=1 Tax=Lycorma delicatula TaxID=130591 RepID=UPI003F50F161